MQGATVARIALVYVCAVLQHELQDSEVSRTAGDHQNGCKMRWACRQVIRGAIDLGMHLRDESLRSIRGVRTVDIGTANQRSVGSLDILSEDRIPQHGVDLGVRFLPGQESLSDVLGSNESLFVS